MCIFAHPGTTSACNAISWQLVISGLRSSTNQAASLLEAGEHAHDTLPYPAYSDSGRPIEEVDTVASCVELRTETPSLPQMPNACGSRKLATVVVSSGCRCHSSPVLLTAKVY